MIQLHLRMSNVPNVAYDRLACFQGLKCFHAILDRHNTQLSGMNNLGRYLLNWNFSVHDHFETGTVDEGLDERYLCVQLFTQHGKRC